MKYILIVFIILVALIILYLMTKGPDISQIEYLKEPNISTMKDQKMVVVEAKGDPNDVAGKAFGLVYKTYFKIKGTSKGLKQPAPRARWPISPDVPKSEWVGFYALPVPEQTVQLPEYKTETGLKVGLTIWEYGDVAQILHIGSYSKEEPTINRLLDFIKKQGYKTVGEHEEEYIKGPGMFLKGNPEKYITIIRYRVKK